MTQLVYLIIYSRVLFNIAVCRWDISLRLIIIVIADKIFNGIMRKKLLEFRAELCRKYFVVRKNKRRAVHSCNDICHRKRLAGACNAEQSLLLHSAVQTVNELIYRLRLIARRLVG